MLYVIAFLITQAIFTPVCWLISRRTEASFTFLWTVSLTSTITTLVIAWWRK